MQIFFVTLLAFAALIGATALFYRPVEKLFLRIKSPDQQYAKDLVEQSAIGWLSIVIYGSFVAFVYFILAVAFSVELLHNSLPAALYYMLIIFPIAIAGSLSLFFLGKAVAIKFIK